MPLYDARCSKCGVKENVWGGVNETLKCECGRTMRRLISASMIHPPFHEYVEENMGHDPVTISSRTQRDRLERERGLYGKTNNRWV